MTEEFIARTIYEACEDMDSADYADTKESDISKMTQELCVMKLKDTTLYRSLEVLTERLLT